MPLQKPSAMGALKSRPTRPVKTPQDTWDVDQLLADSKAFAGEQPVDRAATGRAMADIEASQLRQQQNPMTRLPRVGVVGALADSAATPIRVASGFLGPGAAIGEGIAQGLESIAYLDGKPLPAGGSTLGDATRSIGKVATAGVFGKLASMNPLTSMLKDAPASAATSLAAKLMGKATTAGVGALAGAVEGAVPNVAQGAFTRAFDAGDMSAALDPAGLKLDAALGVGMGGPLGAMLALGKRAGRAGAAAMPSSRFEGPMPIPEAAPWQGEAEEGFQRMQANAGSVRGPAPRQRVPPPGLTGYGNTPPVGPDPQLQLPGPGQTGVNLEMPPSSAAPLTPEVGTQAVTPPQGGSPLYDLLDPSNPYQGPANPTAMPPGVPPVREIPPPPPYDPYGAPSPAPVAPQVPRGRFPAGDPTAEAAQPFAPPEDFFGTPAPVGPDVPRGRIPAGDPTALAAEPFVPPVAEPMAPDTQNRDDFFAAMLEEPPAPAPVDAPMGPMVMQPFEVPVPPALAKGMSNPMFGTPERVKFDGTQIEVFYQGRPQPIRMSPEQFADFSPEMSAGAPRAARPLEAPQGPSAMDDPLMADLLDQVRAERDPQAPALESPAPGILAEPGTTFAPDPTPPLDVAADEQAPFGVDELEAMLRQADAQDAAATPVQAPDPMVELLDPEAAPTQNNGSGESAASTENNNRMASMKAKGQSFVMVDKAGNEVPLIGDAADQHPPPGKTKAIKHADGSYELVEDNGGRLPANQSAKPEVAAPRVNDAEPSELDRIMLEDTPTPPVKAEELFDEPFDAPVDPAPVAPAAGIPEAQGIQLAEGDTPGTINQAGKFAKLGDDWQSHDPAKNKNLVIRKADGTYQVVKANGGKTPKTWSKELADIRESQTAARQAKETDRQAGLAAKKAERETAATAKAEARTAAGQPPEPVVADEPEPVAATPAEPVVGPTAAPKIEHATFGDNAAVDVRFERAPHESIRAALTEYGFRYLPWKQKWSFKIPAGSKLTQADVDDAAQAILRGENPESAQRAINADSLTQKAAAAKLPPTSAPEVPPANPPQAEAPSRPSASASLDPTTTPTTTTPSGTGSGSVRTIETPEGTIRIGPEPDEIKLPASMVKVDADAYQFKTAGNIDAKGRSDKLKGVQEWDELSGKTSRPILHKRLDGNYYVVDGHQRVGLAQDLAKRGTPVDIRAVVLDEADGVTVEDARRAGAVRNMMGGTTDPMDVARVFRDGGDLTPSEQGKIGKVQDPSGERFRQGRDLAKLEPAAFTYLLQTGDTIEPRYARMVSQYQGEDLQVALLRALERSQPQNVSAAKSILAKASDLKATAKQPGIFEDMPEVSDVDYEALVKFEQQVLSVFKKNKRVFGKGLDNAAFLENAGETKIDRDAMAAISSEADRSQFLFDKYANANGSETKRTLQEVFNEHEAGKLSLGAAADRVAKALEADFTGRPTSGGANALPSGDGGPGAANDSTGSLFGDDPPTGGINDPKAVALGRSDGALDDATDDLLERAGAVFKRLLGDERGAVNLEGLGAGMTGLENVYKQHPAAVWSALRTTGGAFFGAATSEDDEASMLDNMVLGAAAGYGAGKLPGLARALKGKAPTFAKALTDTMETGRLIARGEYTAVPNVRREASKDKDISGMAMKFWSPDKVVPDLWKHIEPIMEDIRNIDNGQATVFEARVARRAKLEEAIAALSADSRKARDQGHPRRMKYIDALRDELTNKPTWMERQISEATSGKVSVKTIRKANAIATNAIYHNLLGWGLDSGLANMTQALMNIPQIGVKSTVKGIVKAYTTAGRQELKFLNVARPMGQDEEKLFHPWVETYLDWSQKPMSWSDSGNRRATWAGAMDYAAKRGMGKAESEDFARTLVGQTQGVAGELGSNPFHRNLGPLKVFTKYPTLWASMLGDIATHPDARVKMRFLGLATGITFASAVSGIEWMNFFWPRMGGLPGPNIALDVIDHAVGAPDHDFEEHMELGGTEDRVLPRYLNKGAAILNRSGETRPIVGRKGQQLREISEDEDLLSLFGIETTNRSAARKEESEMYQFAQDSRREAGITSRQTRRKAGLAIAAGDDQAAGEAMRALSRRQQNDFLKDRTRTPLERARRQVPLSRRDEFDERFARDDR